MKRLLWLLLAGIFLIVGDRINSSIKDYWKDVVQACGFAIIMAVSLNIVNGFTGQFAIGHAGFMSVGAYSGASVTYLAMQHLTNKQTPDLWWMALAMLAGGAAAAIFGYIVGVPSLRLRGDYLAIVTLGFGEIIRVLLENTREIHPSLEYMGGATGFLDIPQLTRFTLLWGTVLVVVALARNLKFSLHGLAFLSIREDEIAADAMGVNTTRIKVTAFVMSAFFAGVVGVLFAHARVFKPDTFGFILSMNYVVMIVLGGNGSITGSMVGAVLITLLPEMLKPVKDRIGFRDEYLQVIYAMILVLMMLLRPMGIFGTGEIRLPGFVRRLGGRKKADTAPTETQQPSAEPAPPGTTVLETKDLTRRFGGLTAVGNMSMKLEQGELVGLIGPNGAGKTTAFNLLTGVYEPSEGTITFHNKQIAGEQRTPANRRIIGILWDILLVVFFGWILGKIVSTALVPSTTRPDQIQIQTGVLWLTVIICVGIFLVQVAKRRLTLRGMKPFQFAQRGIARTFQNIRLFGDLTVLENVLIGSYLRRKTNIFDALLLTPRLLKEEKVSVENARALLRRFNLERVEDERARNLPYGDQRRLEIVRALATRPKLLLLDEPAAGMNPQEKVELMGLIRQIRDDFGLTILLIEHDMKLVMGICERIYVLDYGKVIAEGTPQEIRSNPKVIAAYLGEEFDDTDQNDTRNNRKEG